MYMALCLNYLDAVYQGPTFTLSPHVNE